MARNLVSKIICSGFGGGPSIRRKPLRNLAGLPRFELGTACNPIKLSELD